MIVIEDKKKCAGCTACAVSCPCKAIDMEEDEYGFYYPVVHQELCIDCGICHKVCPFNKETSSPIKQETYAVKHKDKQVLANSTSGGLFTALSDYVLQSGGVVYGAAFDENMVVRHMRAENKLERDRMRGSKYVQSDLDNIFQLVKQDLKNRNVLFTGTPCQIAGLKNFLRGREERLICCDLICHGVPSPLVFSEHLKLLKKKIKSKIIDYKFRPKKWGWHIHKEMIVCDNGKEYHSTSLIDMWKNLYYSRIITRPSCANCRWSNLDRCGDITIGDCRGIDKIESDLKSDEGVSLVIVNTQVGAEIFEKLKKDLECKQLNIQHVLQPPLCSPSKENPSQDSFFTTYKKYGYKKAIIQYYGRLYPLKYYVKKWLKKK